MPNLKLYDKQDMIWTESRPQVRNLLFVGGIQCGKTTVGGAWSTRESFRFRPQTKSVGGDWRDSTPGISEDTGIIAAPTYKILQQATLPKFLAMNHGFGTYHKGMGTFTYHWGFTVYMRTATKPESMEGISNCRWVWLDEGGLCPRYFWENCMGRVARLRGRILVTTTPYAMNWLAKLADEAISGERDDTLLTQVRSVDSPYFPMEEYERQKKFLDPRRFAMKYMGQFGKMQGLVFPDIPTRMSMPLPAGTRFFFGIDWGHTDPFVITVWALTPDGEFHRVDEYYQVGIIASEIMDVVRSRHALYKFEWGWADPSRPEYIQELSTLGIPISAGNNDIRLGIDKMIELQRQRRWWLWQDMCPNGLDEYETYHYPEPKERGFDDDEKEQMPVDAHNHGIDADRYCITGVLAEVGLGPRIMPVLPSKAADAISQSQHARIEQLKRRNRNKVY